MKQSRSKGNNFLKKNIKASSLSKTKVSFLFLKKKYQSISMGSQEGMKNGPFSGVQEPRIKNPKTFFFTISAILVAPPQGGHIK